MSHPLGPPPGGAPLAGIDERRRWLSRVEVVYALPREGLLWLPDGIDGPSVATDGITLTARARADESDAVDASREVPVPDAERAALASAWQAAWLAPQASCTPGGPALLLGWRGLFRSLAPADAPILVDALAALIRT